MSDHIRTIAPAQWEADAACSQIGCDPWFPYHYDAESVELPVSICIECPVRELCLDRAMKAEGTAARQHRHGIFGGLTPSQRATLAQDHPDDYEDRRQGRRVCRACDRERARRNRMRRAA